MNTLWRSFFPPRTSKKSRKSQPRLELLEDRCVPASGSVDWNDWLPPVDSLNPASPTTSDVINFTLHDDPLGDPPTYPDPGYPQTPIRDPFGEDDLPVGSR